MSTATTRPRTKGRQKEEAAWVPLQDHWALLNASPETIREAAKADPYPEPEGWPEEQIVDLNQFLADLRVIYICLAHNRQGERQQEASKALKRINQFLKDHIKTELDFDPSDPSALLHYVVTTSWGGERELFHQVEPALEALLEALLPPPAGRRPSKVYACEWCGQIGPAKRSDRRYCGNSCRALASQQRLR